MFKRLDFRNKSISTIICGDFYTIFVDDGVHLQCGNNCIIHTGLNCNISCGYNCRIFCKGSSVIDCGEYCSVICSSGDNNLKSKKGTKFNTLGTNTYDCLDSIICLQRRDTTANVIIPNRKCILRKDCAYVAVDVEEDVVTEGCEDQDDKPSKADSHYNIMEYKNNEWIKSNNIYLIDPDNFKKKRKKKFSDA